MLRLGGGGWELTAAMSGSRIWWRRVVIPTMVRTASVGTVVSSEAPKAAAAAVLVGLYLGGGVALGRATWEVVRSAARGYAASLLGGTGVAVGFAVFSVMLAVRIWTAVLPILGGLS